MTTIKTEAGRKRLAVRATPYWDTDKGRAIGYRAGADTWHARRRVGDRYQWTHLEGPELRAANPGDKYTEAEKLAEAWFDSLTGGAKAHFLIDEAISDYVEKRRIEKGEDSAREAKQMLEGPRVLGKFKGRDLS